MSLGVRNIDPDRVDPGTAHGALEGSLPPSPFSLLGFLSQHLGPSVSHAASQAKYGPQNPEAGLT